MSEQSDAAKKALKNLSPQQRKFAEAFCVSFNGTRAAIAAGYKATNARFQGSRLLTYANIKIAIKAVLDTAAMDPEEIAARWTALARAGLDDFYTKVEYEEPTKVLRPLIERIAELEYDYSFENRVASRQVLDEKQLLAHSLCQNDRRNAIIRLQVELEMNPAATYSADGPPVKKYRVELDLVKATDLGLLDLVKSISYGEFGPKLELRSPDAALDNLAKWRGMLVNKVDVTSGGEKLPASPVLGLLTLDQKKEMLAKMKQAQQEGGASV